MEKQVKYKDIFTVEKGIFNGVIIPGNIPLIQLNALILSKVGQRNITQIVNNFVIYENGIPFITDNNLEVLAGIINSIYNIKWNKIYETLSLEYIASDNYKRKEVENIEVEGDENIVGNEETQNKVYGYDSELATNDKNETVTNSNESTTTNSRERVLTVTGKMGGTSYQSLIREELRLRRDNIFVDMIINDVKNFVVLPIY